MDTVLSGLLTGMVCRTDENADIAFCLRREGHVDFHRSIRLGGLCPIPPDTAFQNACVNRGNQTPLGCGVIACIEPLASLGVVGCTAAVNGFSLSPAKLVASGAFCALIDKRDHLYTAPRFGGSVEICSTTTPGCTRDFVVNTLKADIRRQAPFVLNGPPVGGRAADPLLVPRAIFPNTFYYLGPHLDLLGLLSVSTGTSNPITVELPTGSLIAAVNVADQDHLLVGRAESHIFQEGTSIRSRVVGYGPNTRFALLNELVGPTALGKAQQELRRAVQSAL